MDKDLASALMLERCACYDKALDAAKRVLQKEKTGSEDFFLAKRIIKSLGEEFLRQRFIEKSMECYQVLTDHGKIVMDCPEEPNSDCSPKNSSGAAGGDALSDLGPDTVEITTTVNNDIDEMLTEIAENECSVATSREELFREALYLLISKYAENQTVRESLLRRLASVIKK
jgi:hypothetical protein